MSIHRLPGDVIRNVLDYIPDDQTLVNMAKTYRPMLQVIQGGQATSDEIRLYLAESNIREGPAGAKLRSRKPHDFLERLKKFSFGWAQLQWSVHGILGLPAGSPTTQWADGTKSMDDSFMGESGGCLYFVEPSTPGRGDSILSIFKPPSERMGRPSVQVQFRYEFSIVAVAIDAFQGVFAVLARPPHNGSLIGILVCRLHDGGKLASYSTGGFHSVREPLYWFPDVIIRHFDIIDDVVGFTVEHPICPGSGHMFMYNWRSPPRGRSTVLPYNPRSSVVYYGFQFIQRDIVLISERSSEASGILSLHLRLVSLVNPMDSRNNLFFRTPLLGRTRYERDWAILRTAFIPYIGPIEGQNIGREIPFYFDPSERLVGIRYEYELPDGSTAQSLELFDLKKLRLGDISGSQELPMNNSCSGFVLIGRRLMWTERSHKNDIIHAINFNPNAIPCPSRVISHHEDPSWITQTEHRLFSNFGKALQTRTKAGRQGAFRAVITQDNLMFLVTSQTFALPQYPLAIWDHSF